MLGSVCVSNSSKRCPPHVSACGWQLPPRALMGSDEHAVSSKRKPGHTSHAAANALNASAPAHAADGTMATADTSRTEPPHASHHAASAANGSHAGHGSHSGQSHTPPPPSPHPPLASSDAYTASSDAYTQMLPPSLDVFDLLPPWPPLPPYSPPPLPPMLPPIPCSKHRGHCYVSRCCERHSDGCFRCVFLSPTHFPHIAHVTLPFFL